MPDPGSHAFDVERTRLRGELERDAVPSVPDEHADDAARERLERDHPPRLKDGERAPGPAGSGTGAGAPEATGGIALRSSAFSDHDLIPERYSKLGGNVSPPLEWSGVPDDTRELVLICEDPDAPRGTFLHWALTGIEPQTSAIGENETPPGARAARNGFGDAGWGGPRPPAGDPAHRYFFRLYALAEPLRLGPDATAEQVRDAVAGSALASGTTVGRFAR
jgi:Raf kinase inhibitor-like YbhB/YbcL family protein